MILYRVAINIIKNISRKEIVLIALCCIIGFVLRFYTFDDKSLWTDEVHTFNDSTDNLTGQIRFYKEKPTYLHPPLFYILTHLFYPFPKPERDLRIIPLVFGVLSVPMIYLLSKSFSPHIALLCAFSLTFMAYHINLSQDGRSYSLLMFLGMASLYFLMKHLITSKKGYLFLVALSFATLFYTSYSSIPFIFLSQILWLYRAREDNHKLDFSSFFILNGLIILLCAPWIIFVASNYTGQPLMDPLHTEDPGSFWAILYGVLNDWAPQLPLTLASVMLLILFPFFLGDKRNAFVLLALVIAPIGGLYLFCGWLNVTHFFSSRYIISFLPLFLISIYLSLHAMEGRLERLNKYIRLKFLFAILFIASNLLILPPYYQSEKQDLRGLVNYLKGNLREGDKIFVQSVVHIPGILHYFGAHPNERHHQVSFFKDVKKNSEFRMSSFVCQGKIFSIYSSKTCCTQYVEDGNRLWIVVGAKWTAKNIREESPCVFMGYFDGSFLNLRKFPTDASIYLFLWDPKSPGAKGIDLPFD